MIQLTKTDLEMMSEVFTEALNRYRSCGFPIDKNANRRARDIKKWLQCMIENNAVNSLPKFKVYNDIETGYIDKVELVEGERYYNE